MSMADHTEPLQIAPDPDTLHLFHRQQLSAMLDGELSPDEAKFMLRRLEHDVELACRWERWQLCGELMRGRADGILSSDFAARVAVAVQVPTPCPHMQINAPRRSRRMLWGGMGLAASLALAAGLVLTRPVDNAMSAPVVVAKTSVPAVLVETLPVPIDVDIPAMRAPARDIALAATASAADHPVRELLAPAVPAPVLPRPWPRAGSGTGTFNVGYGSASMPMDPFQPRWVSSPSTFWPEVEARPAPPAYGQVRQD